jgi:hypothetical protein
MPLVHVDYNHVMAGTRLHPFLHYQPPYISPGPPWNGAGPWRGIRGSALGLPVSPTGCMGLVNGNGSTREGSPLG